MNRQGFTLLELAVTTSIIVVAAGLVLIRTSTWGANRQLNDSARHLNRLVECYREKAMSGEARYELTFEERGYTLFESATGTRVVSKLLPEGLTFSTTGPRTLVIGSRLYMPQYSVVLRGETGALRLRWGNLGDSATLEEER